MFGVITGLSSTEVVGGVIDDVIGVGIGMVDVMIVGVRDRLFTVVKALVSPEVVSPPTDVPPQPGNGRMGLAGRISDLVMIACGFSFEVPWMATMLSTWIQEVTDSI